MADGVRSTEGEAAAAGGNGGRGRRDMPAGDAKCPMIAEGGNGEKVF